MRCHESYDYGVAVAADCTHSWHSHLVEAAAALGAAAIEDENQDNQRIEAADVAVIAFHH